MHDVTATTMRIRKCHTLPPLSSTNRLMRFKRIIVVCCENLTEHIRCVGKRQSFLVSPGGTHSYHNQFHNLRLCHLVKKSELPLIREFCCQETITTNIVANGNGVDKHCTSTVHTSDDYTPAERSLRVRHTSSRQACGRSTVSVWQFGSHRVLKMES
jgi:hypothetical protein